MYDLDKLQPLTSRLCPKSNEAHIDIINKSMLKMRVDLAVQIFSRSVARGFRFYAGWEERFEKCESTVQFCALLNDMFDALNTTLIETDLTLGCSEIKILEDCLEWLNAWEGRVNDGSLSPEDFLTPQTVEGLRMILKSTLDLSKYLLQDLKMKAVFTGRISQDSLEGI